LTFASLIGALRSGTVCQAADEEEGLLAIVWHSRTGASEALARAAWDGARSAAPDCSASLRRAADADAAYLLSASGFLFACPENLGGLSGAMKELFDRCYYALLGKVEGWPYASIIAAGSDGSGAQAQLDRIATGWRLRRIAPPMIVNFAADTPERILAAKAPDAASLRRANDLGAAFAAGLAMGAL